MATRATVGLGLGPGVPRREVSVRVGQYNILAANLANNLKSWFWYGYSGLRPPPATTTATTLATPPPPPPPPPQIYRDDGLDGLRAEVFGTGRSPLLADFWAGVLKKYVKIWSLYFDYELQRPSLYEGEDIEAEIDVAPMPQSLGAAAVKLPLAEMRLAAGPSERLVALLQEALLDFLYRDRLDLAAEGDKDLAHHLFVSPHHKATLNFATWQKVAGPVGLGLLDLPVADWEALEEKRRAIDAEKHAAAAPAAPAPVRDSLSDMRWECIADYNRALRRHLADGADSEEAIRGVLAHKCRRLAELVSFSDADMRDILRIQHESFDWQQRVHGIADEMAKRNCHIWAVAEIDAYEDISGALARNPSTSRLRLVAYKHRKTIRADDGVAIYADVERFDVEGVGFVRFSSAAEYRGLGKGGGGDLGLRVHAGRVEDGIITPETEYERQPIPLEGDEAAPAAAVAEMLTGGAAVAYTYTDNLKPEQGRWFDERVATFAVLKAKVKEREADGPPTRILAVATHLWHTQNNPTNERLRLIEAQQMMRALTHFKEAATAAFGPLHAEIVCGDFNDAPNLAWYEGRCNETDPSSAAAPPTPVYDFMVREQGYLDALGQVEGRRTPTTFTMARSYPIDYIMVRRPDHGASGGGGGSGGGGSFGLAARADDVQRVRLATRCGASGDLELLPYGTSRGAVTGTPMPAVGEQPTVPSDHVPVSATVDIEVPL
mmetsp:Transcript_20109/g.61009  ORF Transcript_20109/g.61009 Transcript_20109/m.61009 type:complete len:719 (-) Transcript_20109:83-2239(-)